MNKKHLTAAITGIVLIGFTVGGAAFSFADNSETEVSNGTISLGHQSEADYPGLATVSMNEAMDIARQAINGEVLKAELEDENGFLVYGVEIVTADKAVMEAKVDAGSGRVLQVKHDKRDGEREDDRDDG